jgi:hypothetical protein
MLQKLLLLAFGVTVIGHLFFRPQLRQLGRRVDRLVTLMVVAIAITWAGQILFLLYSGR